MIKPNPQKPSHPPRSDFFSHRSALPLGHFNIPQTQLSSHVMNHVAFKSPPAARQAKEETSTPKQKENSRKMCHTLSIVQTAVRKQLFTVENYLGKNGRKAQSEHFPRKVYLGLTTGTSLYRMSTHFFEVGLFTPCCAPQCFQPVNTSGWYFTCFLVQICTYERPCKLPF